ncbi:ISPD [Symbiodinium natans]|uniref:ISPD protein n=1 Tax=Symbiodinium natans TaxID=878477 RepID=A0A812ILX2_9DINO|nr:ISPD [Symbiodinium natans]
MPGNDATLKQRYPRRWYDAIIPFESPWESRPTVGEVRERLEAQTNLAAWRIERKARATEQNSTKAGTIVFWLIVLVLTVAPLLARTTLNGPISPMCFEAESSECEVVPYPRIAVYCALGIVVLFKACSVDMSCGPWGAMPPMFTPAYGRTSSLDFVQQAKTRGALRGVLVCVSNMVAVVICCYFVAQVHQFLKRSVRQKWSSGCCPHV